MRKIHKKVTQDDYFDPQNNQLTLVQVEIADGQVRVRILYCLYEI